MIGRDDKIKNQGLTPLLGLTADGARLYPESGLRLEAVEDLIHNSRFDTCFGRDALRSIHTNSNRVRQMLPAPILKGGDTRLHVIIRCLNENQHLRLKRTEKKEVNF